MNRRATLFVGLLIVSAIILSVIAPVAAQEAAGNMIPLDHPMAAFLESRAYGASLGATAEFNKMEWVVLDSVNMRYYLSMSDITGAMVDGEGDISVDENRCGIVYTADIAEDFSISELRPLVIGGPFNAEGGSNRCDVNNISNPDGLALDAQGRLWISEDTSNHRNNMVWVYDPADGSLTRFGYTPRGAEITGFMIAPNGTIMFSNQHPSATDIYPYNAGTVFAVNGFNANTDSFEEIAVPEGAAQLMAGVAAGELQVIARSGDPIPNSFSGDVFGGIYRTDGSLQYVNNDPDGLMWLPVGEAGTEGWLYINYEGIAGGVGRAYLVQSAEGWEVVDGEMVDFSSVNGTWTNCGSSVTPWNTGLTSEEYEPIAADFNNVAGMSDYLGSPANPYDYGWIVELAPSGVNDRVTKRYAMGRFSHENSFVAGDNITVYYGDDGGSVMLFKFIAAEAGNLSAGTLYAAKITQMGGTGAEHTLQIEWIELGTAADADIEAAVRELDR
jgi:secreted PhoX family phosphatase